MKQLDLVIPGLLGPFADNLPDYIQQQLKQPAFSVINKCLTRADLSNVSANTYYATLVSLIYPQCTQSLCQITADFDGIDTAGAFFYRADPVHFKAESDHAILIGPELVVPEIDEVKQLISVFNQHFLEDNLSLHATHENRWYLRSEKFLNLEFSALDYALGRDIKHFMPKGEDELWWRKIINEAQMLFFQHDINQARESSGQLSINGLWLWDIAFTSNQDDSLTPVKANPTKLLSNEVLALALGKQASIDALTTNEINDVNSSSVLVLDQLYESVCYGDVDAWLEDLRLFCDDEFKSIVNLLSSKKIDVINIYPCNGQVFKVNRVNLLKFWKQNKTISKYITVQ